MHVQIVLFDGFDLLDAIAPYEVFSAAAMYSHKKITVELVSAEGPRIAHAVEKLFEYERRGTVWKNTGDSPIEMKTFQEGEPESDNPINPSNAQANVEGKWEAVISTPIDKLSVLLEFTYRDGAGVLPASPLTGRRIQGAFVKWKR